MIAPSRYTCDYLALKGQFNEGLRELENRFERPRSYIHGLNDYQIIGRKGCFEAMLGKTQTASRLLAQAIQSAESDSPVHSESLCCFLVITGELHFHLENFSEAAACLNRALNIARRNYLAAWEAYILKCYGDIHRLGGIYEKALENYNKSLEIAAKLHTLWPESFAKLGLAELALADDSPDIAIPLLNNVLLIAQMDGWLVQQIHAHQLFTELYLIKDNPPGAQKHLHIARKMRNISGYFWARASLLRLTEEVLEGR